MRLNIKSPKLIYTPILLFYFLFFHPLFAQDPNDFKKENLLEQNIENIAGNNSDEGIDYTLIFDELLHFTEHPVNLNNANREDLQQLIVLNDMQINNLLKHIENNGALIALEELQSISGFDVEIIQKILPYVKINSDLNTPNISFKEILQNGRNQLFLRQQQVIQEQQGFSTMDNASLAKNPNSRYLGDKNKVYARYRFNYGTNVSLGFTAEKDPGEQFFKGNQKQGFDFYSAHLFLKNFGKLKALALGDYQAQFGQGLTFCTGLGLGKSSYIMNIKRNAMGLKPYTAVDENRFLRGAASTLGYRSFELTSFFSHKNVDANVQSEIDSLILNNEVLVAENNYISSLEQTGFHRTPTENNRRKSVSETNYGGHLTYKRRNLNIGSTFVHTNYGIALNRDLNYYNQFEFNGSQNYNVGLDYNYIFRNFNFFGEVSRSRNGALAHINGVLLTLDPKLSVVLQYRNYSRDYQSQYSNAIGENTKNANEQGLYVGLTAGPFQKVTVSAYYDRFHFPWMKYQVNASSYGEDCLVQLNYTPSKTIDMYGRVRMHEKLKNTRDDIDDIDYLVSENQINYRYNITYTISPSIKLRNRAEIVEYQFGNDAKEHGYLLFQDVVYKSLKSPLSFSFRYALFDTDSYNSRIYAYENDVLYSFSIPAYYYRGSRAYLTLRYSYKKSMDIWIRYAQTISDNQKTIGTGLDQIAGNVKSDVKLQLRFKF